MEDPHHILVVDDDPSLCLILSRYLTEHNFNVVVAHGAQEMSASLNNHRPDLVILDWMLPDGNGLALASELRRTDQDIGIIMLTGKIDPGDRVDGLESGADDYIVKPFEVRELLARVRSVLRRRVESADKSITYAPRMALFDGWKMDLIAHTLHTPNGIEVILTGQEFRILSELINSAPDIVSRDRLRVVLTGTAFDPLSRTVDVLIAKIRQKIEADRTRPRLILTIRGMGYQFGATVQFDCGSAEPTEP